MQLDFCSVMEPCRVEYLMHQQMSKTKHSAICLMFFFPLMCVCVCFCSFVKNRFKTMIMHNDLRIYMVGIYKYAIFAMSNARGRAGVSGHIFFSTSSTRPINSSQYFVAYNFMTLWLCCSFLFCSHDACAPTDLAGSGILILVQILLVLHH